MTHLYRKEPFPWLDEGSHVILSECIIGWWSHESGLLYNVQCTYSTGGTVTTEKSSDCQIIL